MSENNVDYGARSRVGLVLGPVLFVALLFTPVPAGMPPEAWSVVAVAALMATWWITEAIPIAATAMLPLPLFPLLGVNTVAHAAAPFANPVLYLFMGGFMIAQAMQRWGLHRRAALNIIQVVGVQPGRMVAGFMAASAFLSMWVSNTATTVMMTPIAISVIQFTGSGGDSRNRHLSRFAIALMLAVAYAASIGGIGTLVGTAPNALFAGFMRDNYGVNITFAQWMMVGLPMVFLMVPIAWWILTRGLHRLNDEELRGAAAAIHGELHKLGRISREELTVAVVFTTVALSWIGRPLLARLWPGITDAGIAIIGALSLFALPADWKRGTFILDWKNAVRLPWDVLLLLGGGLSLAQSIRETGLADWLGGALSGLEVLPLIGIMVTVALVMIFFTELTSNTASTAAFLPLLAALAIGIGESPLFLAVPAVIAASCAFMMPVATPPNAIVYGSGYITVPQMARMGIQLNLALAFLIPLFAYLLVGWVFGGQPGVMPDWAVPK